MASKDAPLTQPGNVTSPDLVGEFYKAYEEHSKVLRTWLVAYGIGAPVLFLTNDTLAARLAESGSSASVGALFLLGVAAQVGLAAVNKTMMWACYYSERNPSVQERWWSKAAYWLGKFFLIDLMIDVVTLALFGSATWILFGLLTATDPTAFSTK